MRNKLQFIKHLYFIVLCHGRSGAPMSPQFLLTLAMLLVLSKWNGVQAIVNFYLDEEVDRGTLVGNFATQLGLSPNENTYTLVPMSDNYDGSKLFRLDVKTGDLRTNARIDRDALCAHFKSCCNQRNSAIIDCIIPLKITQRGLKSYKLRFETIHVHVNDLNDNIAQWSKPLLVRRILENPSSQLRIFLEAAVDPDVGLNGTQRYDLIDPSNTFQISRDSSDLVNRDDNVEVALIAVKALDREKQEIYNLTLVAYDGATPSRSGSVQVQIQLQDMNDNSPRFERNIYRMKVREDVTRHSQLLQVRAIDPDEGANGQVVYELVTRTATSIREIFQVGRDSGRITLIGRLDYDTMGSDKWYSFQIVARDQSSEPLATTCTVSIQVEDVNDCKPRFSLMRIDEKGQLTRFNNRVEIPENEEAGYTVALASVEDCDSGLAGQANCQMMDDNLLHLQLPSGDEDNRIMEIVTRKRLDREYQELYTVNVVCRDKGDPSFESTYDIRVQVLDKNDNAPVFHQTDYTFSISEELAAGSFVGKVVAQDSDADKNGKITYDIINGVGDDAMAFDINRQTGELRTARLLDREVKEQLRLAVVAHDGGKTSLSATVNVLVHVKDENDQTPKFTHDHYKFQLRENQPAMTLVGLMIATDADLKNNAFIDYRFDTQTVGEYHISRDGFPFLISASPDNSSHALLHTSRSVDREAIQQSRSKDNALDNQHSVYNFQVLAIDRGYPQARTGYTLVTVTILDINDERPRWIFPSNNEKEVNNIVNVTIDSAVGYAVTILRAVDLDMGEHAHLEYRIESGDPEGLFLLDPESGTLQVCRKLTKIRTYRLIVVARDFPSARSNETRFETKALLRINVVPNLQSRNTGDGQQRRKALGNEKDHNVVIIIVLISATAAIALLLLLIIVLARCFVGRRTRGTKMTLKNHGSNGMQQIKYTTASPVDGPGAFATQPLTMSSQSVIIDGAYKTLDGGPAFFTTDLQRIHTPGTIRRQFNTNSTLPAAASATPGARSHVNRQESSLNKAGSCDGLINLSGSCEKQGCNNYEVSTLLCEAGHTQLIESCADNATDEWDSANGSNFNVSPRTRPPTSYHMSSAYQTLQPATSRYLTNVEPHYYDVVTNHQLKDCASAPVSCTEHGTPTATAAASAALDLRNYFVRDSIDKKEETAKFRNKQKQPIYQASFV